MNPLVRELLARQRMLALYGLGLIALTALPLIAQAFDARTITGVNVWVKPAKFLFSIGVYAVTMAWLFGFVRPERREAPSLRATVGAVLAGGTFEAVYITFQAAQGLDSHFNVGTPFHATMYVLMGVFATVLVSATLPLAWEIGRRPAAGRRSDLVHAVVAGLVLTFALGGVLGGYMSAQPGHAVGAVGGHVPVFGWNREGGDLRVAHFLGIHAQQVLPLMAVALGALDIRERVRRRLVWGGATLYAIATLAVFVQAVAGQPFQI